MYSTKMTMVGSNHCGMCMWGMIHNASGSVWRPMLTHAPMSSPQGCQAATVPATSGLARRAVRPLRAATVGTYM